MRNVVKTGLLLTLLLGATGAWAQKIDQRLTGLVEQVIKTRGQATQTADLKAMRKHIAFNMNEDGSINSLSAIATLAKGAECPTEKLEQMGIKVRFVLGDMVALVIPTDKLMLLEGIEEFIYVKADEICRLKNEEARKNTKVEQVNTAEAAALENLPKAYTGAGVVIGMIDSGIDFNHAAFRNADGTTRIKRAWDYKTRTDYTTDEQIKALTCDERALSHGTHTSAIAAGSPTGNGQQGMAPEADLYLCGINGDIAMSDAVECMDKIFKYAESVGKPAVINMSIGNVLGLHDGSNETAKAAATLTDNGNAKGRAVVISASNNAANYESIVAPLRTSTSVAGGWQLATVLGAATIPSFFNIDAPVVYTGGYYIYAGDYKDFELKLAVVDILDGTVEELGSHVLDKNNKVLTVNDILKKETQVPTLKGTTAIAYRMDFNTNNIHMDKQGCRLALFAKGSSDGQVVKMICDGDDYAEPCFDAPNDEASFDFTAVGYTKGNGDLTCSTSVCTDCVISVGAYITRTQWKSHSGETEKYEKSKLTDKVLELGAISDFSSYCYDDNGTPRPTIIAPGQGIISAINNYDKNYFLENQAGEVLTESSTYPFVVENVVKNDRNNWYGVDQGTSMSAPVASGIIALWMQANPNLSANDIIAILKETCRNDEYTTDVTKIPSGQKIQAGLGKIDCLAGLKKVLNATGIETVAADGQREATPATMYSVDAPVYNMMGQRVDKSQRGIVIYKGRKYLNR